MADLPHRAILAALVLFCCPFAGHAGLTGHGGPVRALANDAGCGVLLSGSFDTSIISWNMTSFEAETVRHGHDGAVNALAVLPDCSFLSAGDDGRVFKWQRGELNPAVSYAGHGAPVSGLALSPDGKHFASSSWDGTVRVWDLNGGGNAIIAGHTGPVNAVAYFADGALASGGYDGTVKIWRDGLDQRSIALPAPVNKLVAAGASILIACADGHVRTLDVSGAADEARDFDLGPVPIVSLAVDANASLAVAGAIDGKTSLIDLRDAKVLRQSQGRGGPVWSLLFGALGREFLTGSGDGIIRRWTSNDGSQIDAAKSPVQDGAIPPILAGTAGARVFRACTACHGLEDDASKAGPSLHRIFGRKAGTLAGYDYSPAFKNLDIVWSRETISQLFDIGPHAYTPGTKMPEQRLTEAERAALVQFLEEATR